MTKEEYIKAQTKVAKILRPDLGFKNLQVILLQDWNRDTAGNGFLTKSDIFDSLFELGDIWTPEVDVYQ